MPPLSPDGRPALNDVVSELLGALETQAAPPPSPGGLPAPSVALVELVERPVGLGALRGQERRGTLPFAALKGGRLEVLVRFELWHDDAGGVASAAATVHANLLAGHESLRGLGFLRLTAAGTPPAEQVSTGVVSTAWRGSVLYRALFEFQWVDTDGAESLLVRIPVAADPEEPDSPNRELRVVTGPVARWDQEEALPFVLRGPLDLRRLDVLAFLPGAVPSGQVTLRRTFDGAAGPPTAHAGLAAFLAALHADPPARHDELAFASLGAFLAAFDPPEPAAEMGDWDGDASPDLYEERRLDLAPGVPLAAPGDRFEIRIDTAPLDSTAVLYLRLERA